MKKIMTGLLLMLSTLGNAAENLSLDVNTNQKQFVISLAANPTTGFQWTLQHYDQTFLELVGSHYQAPQSKLIGAGGQMIFTFALLAGKSYPKKTTINFKYAQPWEPSKGSLKTVEINFQ